METFGAIESRRAVKQYDPNHRFTPEEENKLLGAALLSPTAFNIQQWRFVVLRDMEIRKQIRAVAWDQAQVTEASMLAARDMGYDSCPMDGFDYETVGKIINLPSDHAISFMVAIGKKTQEPWPRPGQLSYGKVVLENGF
ncbi:MAG: nitroreductase family protein [Verrucomicrobia bacterium]|nr:nitroreductase family protein [Verrucomicrobiota bacterium]